MNNNYRGVATGGGGYNPYSTGRKIYGSGRSFPTSGPVDPSGYRERDLKEKSRRNAILKRMQAGLSKNYGSGNYLRDLGS